MKEKAGRVFSVAEENKPVKDCTISKAVSDAGGFYISHFSLAKGTNISAELYRYPKLWILLSGKIRMSGEGGENRLLLPGDLALTPVGKAVGTVAEEDSVYTEISLKEETKMKDVLKSKEVFALKDMLPCQEGKIVNMDLIDEEDLKLVLMSFGAGTGLQEHAAPGEALIFALEGEGVIGYEGREYVIKAGENFKFDKGGAHYVKAEKEFKMALLLTLA